MADNSNGFYQSSFASTPVNVGGATNMNNTTSTANQQYYMNPTQHTNFDDEPPLLEELGINVQAVIAKVRKVANPFSRVDSSFADDADMTGPICLCLLLGFLLTLQRKVLFGVIYGLATLGCIGVYFVFNLMSQRGIDLYRSTSILGYSLLPMVILCFPTFFTPRAISVFLSGACVLWSSTTAAKIFTAVLALDDQFWLVWYPLALLYTPFALITVF